MTSTRRRTIRSSWKGAMRKRRMRRTMRKIGMTCRTLAMTTKIMSDRRRNCKKEELERGRGI